MNFAEPARKSYLDLREVIIPLLRCPVCKSPTTLMLKKGVPQTDSPLPYHSEHLHCEECAAVYPITEDYIPIMWTTSLKRAMSGSKEPCTLAANVAIYDAISDDYQQYSRKAPEIALRLENAIKKLLTSTTLHKKRQSEVIRHLDYGCGPGHVLGWSKGFGFSQIGMDISLRNLRNARSNTGCLVVCGDASSMPFADETMDIVTESSALHHIVEWSAALKESSRVCKRSGGIVVDCEPSKSQLDWSRLAVVVYDARFAVYKALSYIKHDKYIFRDTAQAKLNLLAEVHHQPGTGFPLDEVEKIFAAAGFRAEIVRSPGPDLLSRGNPGWRGIILSVLSGRNPWNPEYGPFTAICVSAGR
jgi:ubiquinone/menaquinone biosynthesis C-methylase UbiE/uncharacterized protein YbaR (Trm112 family)